MTNNNNMLIVSNMREAKTMTIQNSASSIGEYHKTEGVTELAQLLGAAGLFHDWKENLCLPLVVDYLTMPYTINL